MQAKKERTYGKIPIELPQIVRTAQKKSSKVEKIKQRTDIAFHVVSVLF